MDPLRRITRARLRGAFQSGQPKASTAAAEEYFSGLSMSKGATFSRAQDTGHPRACRCPTPSRRRSPPCRRRSSSRTVSSCLGYVSRSTTTQKNYFPRTMMLVLKNRKECNIWPFYYRSCSLIVVREDARLSFAMHGTNAETTAPGTDRDDLRKQLHYFDFDFQAQKRAPLWVVRCWSCRL